MKRFFVVCIAMVATMVSFISCSSDKDEVNVIEQLVGNYNMKATMSVVLENGEEQNVGTYETIVSIVQTTDSSVKLSIKSFGKDHYVMPDIEVIGVTVDKIVDGIALLRMVNFDAIHNSVVYDGTIQGSYSNGNLALTMSVQPGQMPYPINVVMKLK